VNQDLYEKHLIYSVLVNTVIMSLYSSFEIMVTKKVIGRQHGIQIIKLTIIDHEDFVIKLYAIDSDTVTMSIFFNKKKIDTPECQVILSKNTNIKEFLAYFVKVIVDEYLNRYGKEHHSIVLKNKIKNIKNQLPTGFIKKIREIKQDGSFFKYIVVFDDNDYHQILTPYEIPASVKIGDYAYLDEHDRINFIPRTSVQ